MAYTIYICHILYACKIKMQSRYFFFSTMKKLSGQIGYFNESLLQINSKFTIEKHNVCFSFIIKLVYLSHVNI